MRAVLAHHAGQTLCPIGGAKGAPRARDALNQNLLRIVGTHALVSPCCWQNFTYRLLPICNDLTLHGGFWCVPCNAVFSFCAQVRHRHQCSAGKASGAFGFACRGVLCELSSMHAACRRFSCHKTRLAGRCWFFCCLFSSMRIQKANVSHQLAAQYTFQ